MNYKLLEWPEAQLFFDYRDELYFDPKNNVWFINELIYKKVYEI